MPFQYSASIEENCLSSELIRFQTIDLDEEGTDNWLAKYLILSGNDGNWFDIQTDPQTNEGILKVVKVWYGIYNIRFPRRVRILRERICLQHVHHNLAYYLCGLVTWLSGLFSNAVFITERNKKSVLFSQCPTPS